MKYINSNDIKHNCIGDCEDDPTWTYPAGPFTHTCETISFWDCEVHDYGSQLEIEAKVACPKTCRVCAGIYRYTTY
jgi:hypothetical protein